MAPSLITEDYYMILQVDRKATIQVINSSYRRLALVLHPDRNGKPDATEAFQRLGRAYETLRDEAKRREYDLILPSLAAPQTESLSDVAQIAAIQKSKKERDARWQSERNAYEWSISELQRVIQQLEQERKSLDSIVAAEAAAESQRNSWTTWFLSPIYTKVEDSQDEKLRKEIERQERRVEKDMKERRLEWRGADLKAAETRLQKTKEQFDAANLADNRRVAEIQARIRLRELWESQEREKAERERMAALRQQQQQAAEVLRRQQAERRAAEQKRQEEAIRNWHYSHEESRGGGNRHAPSSSTGRNTRQAHTAPCHHNAWWSKVEGRTACPECHEIWTYLLQCPSCEVRACPKCQATMRPRKSNNRANRKFQP